MHVRYVFMSLTNIWGGPNPSPEYDLDCNKLIERGAFENNIQLDLPRVQQSLLQLIKNNWNDLWSRRNYCFLLDTI